MQHPNLEDFRTLCAQHSVVPVYQEIVSDTLTPVSAFATVGEGPGSYLLESVVGGEKWGRYSFVGCNPDLIVRGGGTRFECWRGAGASPEVRRGVDPWQELRALLQTYRPAVLESLPRFWGGAVGYVAYDAVRRFEPTVAEQDDEDEFAFSIGGAVLIFDSLRQTVNVVVPALVPDRPADVDALYRESTAKIDSLIAKLRSPKSIASIKVPEPTHEPELPASSFDRPRFCEAVERAQEYIRAGDIFQVVFSQRFRVAASGTDLFDVYRTMRIVNPSPYMYFLKLPDVSIAGASPETLVRLEDGVAEVRPIAGTRRRGASAEEDRARELDMLADPKELAEHVMLVDLGRNDLGRVSTPGSVRITEQMAVERYSHVMHLASNVVGTLVQDRDALDLLRATFPAGTLSGAPKVRAMQIIEELEPEARGIYGGAVGYLGFDGNMDMAIAIRTIIQRKDEFWIQAGAGIVEASSPDGEYDETVHKARAALVAIEAART
ncbi:MAG: anthranilate synthase component I family protein [Myxococcota bacterium]